MPRIVADDGSRVIFDVFLDREVTVPRLTYSSFNHHSVEGCGRSAGENNLIRVEKIIRQK